MKGSCFLSLQESLYVPFRERKKVSLKSEDTSNAEQRKEANGPTGRTQDTTEYVLSNALAWGCRQIACGHNSQQVCRRWKVWKMQGETSSGFVSVSNVPLRFSSSRQILIPFWKFHHQEKVRSLVLERRNEFLENILYSYAFLAHENIIILWKDYPVIHQIQIILVP